MSANGPIEEVTPAQVIARLREENPPLLLDIREPEELQLAALAEAAHIPMNDLPVRITQLDPDRETIVICHHGRRSYSAALWLREQGFDAVKSMRGGIDAWSMTVDAAIPRY